MNYYNPYYMYPYMNMTRGISGGIASGAARSGGLFSRLFNSNITFDSILNGAQRVLNITNQALPLVKQAGPIVKNAKTMFKIMNEFNKTDTPKPSTITKSQAPTKIIDAPKEDIKESPKPTSHNNLTFFQ